MHIQLRENTLEVGEKDLTLTEISRWMWEHTESLDELGRAWLGRCFVVLWRDLSVLELFSSVPLWRCSQSYLSCPQPDIAAAGRQLWARAFKSLYGISKNFLSLEFSLGKKVPFSEHCFQQALLLKDSWGRNHSCDQRTCREL